MQAFKTILLFGTYFTTPNFFPVFIKAWIALSKW